MTKHLHKCSRCQAYTLEEKCPQCGAAAVMPRPPKFSINDKYADLRRKAKKEELIKEGLF